MEEEVEKMSLKKKFIIGGECIAVVAIVVIFVAVLYNVFYNNNIKTIQTSANDGNKNKAEPVISEDESTIEVQVEEDQEEVIEISEEAKQKIVDEEKKQEEEQKKQEEERKKREEQQNKVSNYPYYLKVNYTANTVTAYAKDAQGKFTVPVRAMVCSTGKATPRSGVYKTPNKYRWKLLIGNSYGQYSTRITGQILFHSVPYERQSEDSLITRYYDRLGITTSLGCIRLTVADAKWIYDNCPLGTSVEFYSSSNPGPLGKPSAKKITNASAPLNTWDPTDPNPNNPWRKQTASTEDNKAENNTTSTEENKKTDSNTSTAGNTTAGNTSGNVITGNATNGNVAGGNTSAGNTTTGNTTSGNTTGNTGDNKTPANTTVNQNNDTKITIKDVLGKSESEARKLLANLNIVVKYDSNKAKANGTVLAQSLPTGSLVGKGTTITLTINKIEETKNETVNTNTNKTEDKTANTTNTTNITQQNSSSNTTL